MNCSESISKVAAALVKVQAELEPVKKDANNPFFKSRYASLSAIWEMVGPILVANNLAVTQIGSPSGLEMTICLETVLIHSSGEWISGEITVPLAKADPQGVGSAITYCRRYGLAALLGVLTEDDDDGNAASHAPAGQQKQKGSSAPAIDTSGMTPAQRAIAERKAAAADPVQAQEAAADATGRGDTPPDAPTPAEETQAEAQATSTADLLSPAQMTMLKKAASEKGLDLDICSLGEFDVPVADLSKAAATKLMAKIKAMPATEGSTDNAPYMTPTHTGDPNKLPGMENAFGGPTPVPPATPPAAPPPVVDEHPDPAGEGVGMGGGFGDDPTKKATPKQLATLAKISAKVGVSLTDMIAQEFIDAQTPDQLSKKGASHLIDLYTPD